MKKRIGFIGTGKITSAIVEGFCKHGDANNEIIVSYRNKDRSARLGNGFSRVRVAKNNQEVVDNSEIVFFALLPHEAPPVIKELTYREDLKIISVIPMIVVEELEKMVYPAVNITRAIPLPPAAYHFGSVLYYPESEYAGKLLSELGNPIPLSDEHQLHVLWAVTGLISPFFTMLAEISNRAVEYGADRTISKKYIAAMFGALSNLAFETGGDFLEMADEAATPGGLNEQARKMIAEAGGYKSFIDALDAIVKRFPD